MKNLDDARKLAETMVAIGRLRGRQVRAALSSMEEPLGSQIGNALEVDEALRIRREEELPVYERLGDVHSRAITQLKIARGLLARPFPDFSAARLLMEQALSAFTDMRLPEAEMARSELAELDKRQKSMPG